MVAERLSQHQDAEEIPETTDDSEEDIAWEPVPKKRIWRARLASFITCLLAAAGIVYYAVVVENTIVEFHVDDEISKELTATKNKTIVCYKREEKETFPVLFTLSFGLLGIILGTFLDRLLLVFEEIFHFKSRHNKRICKMFQACFSGISLGAVFAVIILIGVTIIAPLLKKATLEKKYLWYMLSAIGVGPLIMRLLNLNTESEVHISTIIEKKETCIAHGLAWSYYFNYLDKALPKFSEKFPNESIPPAENGESRGYLNSNKMLLLISHDCYTEDNLAVLDNKIEKLYDIKHDGYCFPVYCLTYNGTVRRYVVKYVKQPLETLDKMSIHGRIKALNESELEYQVKLLYRTLLDILNNPLNKQYKEKCILIPIKAKSLGSLQDGGLARLIIHKVERDEPDGFMKPCSAKRQRPKQPKENETLDADDKPKDEVNSPTSSFVVNINPAKSSVRYSKQEGLGQPNYHASEEQTNGPTRAPVDEQRTLLLKDYHKPIGVEIVQPRLANKGETSHDETLNKANLPTSGHVVDTNAAESSTPESRKDFLSQTYSEDENNPLVPDKEQTKKHARAREKGKLTRKYKKEKSKVHEQQPMLSDNNKKFTRVSAKQSTQLEEKKSSNVDEKTTDEVKLPVSSDAVNINLVKSRARCRRGKHSTKTDNPADENNASVYPEDTKELPKDKEPVKGQRQIKYRGENFDTSEQQPTLSNNDGKSFCVELPEKTINESGQADDDGGVTMIQSSQVSPSTEDQHDRISCPTGKQHVESDPMAL